MARRVLAIVNPISGRRNTAPLVRRIGRLLEHAGGTLHVERTAGAGHATELAARACGRFDAVLVVGGDGTVCEVVNGLIDRPVPIAILPTGTANLLAHEFTMPRKPKDVAELLLRGQPFSCDVGVVNEQRFLAMVGVGFDAEVVRRLTARRTGHISFATYLEPVWSTFRSYRFPDVRIEADGECLFEGRGLAFVGLIKRHSIGLRILQRARPDDGLLDLCVLPCKSRLRVVRHFVNIVLRRHLRSAGVLYRQAKVVRITSSDNRVPVQIDGDVGGTLPVECSILPGAAAFLRLETTA